MEPYQEATEELRRRAQGPKNTLATAGAIAGSVIGGGALASRILPLLSQYVPGELMRKGLAKVSPKIGSFVDSAINNGYSLDDVRQFMTEKFTPQQEQAQPEEPQENPIIKEAKNFETNYPDIVKAIMRTIEKGHSPQSGAELLKKSDVFKARIKKIEKETGKNFVDFIVELMGNQPMQQQAQPQEQVQPTQQTQPQPQAQPQGGVDPQLLSLIQGIRGSLQGMRNG